MGVNKSKVLVRAYREKVAVLFMVGIYGNRVEVCCEDESAKVRVLASDVYEFDPELFAKLDAAGRKNDIKLAARLWSTGRHIGEATAPRWPNWSGRGQPE